MNLVQRDSVVFQAFLAYLDLLVTKVNLERKEFLDTQGQEVFQV